MENYTWQHPFPKKITGLCIPLDGSAHRFGKSHLFSIRPDSRNHPEEVRYVFGAAQSEVP